MAGYNPPKIDELAFRFSSGGYQKPQFDNLSFNFGAKPSYSSTADLQASIEVMTTYTDSTYTYTKECRTIVTGYSSKGIQTLKLPCLYGGIRDLNSLIYGNPNHRDLSADILGVAGGKTLAAWVRVNYRIEELLVGYIVPTVTKTVDIPTWSRFNTKSSRDIQSGLIRIFQAYEVQKDLSSYLNTIQPIDLQCLLNVIEIRHISADITGIWWKGTTDIYTEFQRFFLRKDKILNATIYGRLFVDLSSTIVAFWTKDLTGLLNAGNFKRPRDIGAFLNTIQPVDIGAYIHGLATKDISFSILGNLYGPNDIQAIINTVQPKDITAYIHGLVGLNVPKTLLAYIIGSTTSDLTAFIDLIKPKDLYAYINSIGNYIDLSAYIVPRTIKIKRVVSIPLMEYKDLAAVVNFSCMFSTYRDLSAYIYVFKKKDLRASIVGWYSSGSADTVKDLGAYINHSNYKVTDTINISGSASTTHYVTHDVSGGYEKSYRVLDTYNIFGGSTVANLSSYINGILNSVDLGAQINPIYLPSFTSIPSWVNPKYREVFINLNRFEDRWSRFVDLMFQTNDDTNFRYFYVSGSQKAYKIDKNRTWTILLTGYDTVEDDMIDRANVRKKIIFNLANYNSIDEAIRDIMDRVVSFRQRDLPATISALMPPHSNLQANIKVNYVHKWSKNLLSIVKVINTGSGMLSTSIHPELFKGSNNLSSTIVGKFYEPPASDNAEFIFKEAGYEPPVDLNNVEWTSDQADDFWKKE